jgi:phage terminase large subunit GpA-like protein
LISTLGDVTLPRLVQKWLAARASGPAALMSFVTTVLAEPWEDRGARVEPHALAARLEDYGEGVDAPAGVIALTCGVDVQIDRFEVGVYGWGRRGESWLIDQHVVPGDPTQPDVQAALLAALDEPYRHAAGHTLPVLAACLDAGYLPEKVAYTLAARRPRRYFAGKGIGGRFGEPSILKYDPRHPPAILNVDGLKLETALGLEMAAPGPGYLHLSRRCCDEDVLAQLCAEHRETKRRNGVATLVWVEDRAANHALDCAVYARAALRLLARVSGARTDDALLASLEARTRIA